MSEFFNSAVRGTAPRAQWAVVSAVVSDGVLVVTFTNGRIFNYAPDGKCVEVLG